MISQFYNSLCLSLISLVFLSACGLKDLRRFAGFGESDQDKAELFMNSQENPTNTFFNNLKNIQNSGRFIFGQQSFSFMSKDDAGEQNVLWYDKPLLDSASRKIVGDDPGILGVAVHYFALISNQRSHMQTAKAIRSHLDQDGIVAFEWHMRGCFSDDDSEKGMYTNVASYGAKGAKKENIKCICAIANNWPVKNGIKGRDWLNQRLDKFSQKVKALGSSYANKPMIFRPLHEHTGNWFWWGEPYWNCNSFSEASSTSNLITGPEAYKNVFRQMVNRIRSSPNDLSNFLIAYSPDKLYVDGWDYSRYPPGERSNKNKSIDQLKQKYFEALPSEVVDIYGFDIYNPMEWHGGAASLSVRAVSELAKRDSKVAALTEVGSYEIDNGKKGWYMNDLLSKTIGNSQIAFAMTWENRAKSYVPAKSGLDQSDFRSFYNSQRTLFRNDIKGILGGAMNPPPPEKECIDEDGDGWGWDGEKSCKIENPKPCIDEDGDGWGWDGEKSCKIENSKPCIDEDGDGWGWDGEKSCKIEDPKPCIDEDGDGWGWDGEKSCRI